MSSPYREIIVGTDGSPTARRAVVAAASLAKACDATLVVATAWYRNVHEPPSKEEQAHYGDATPASHELTWANEMVSDAAGVARASGVEDVRVLTPTGNAADALLRLGEERPGSLIVVGTVGLDSAAERLLGNIPHQLTHHSSRDVYLVARPEQAETAWGSVALATDGSATAGLAVARGAALARAVGASVTLLTVARDEARGEQVLSAAAEAGVEDADRQVVVGRGDVAKALISAAGDYDLLVMGNKGMSGPSRLLGSVSNKVTHEVPTDVLLVNTTR